MTENVIVCVSSDHRRVTTLNCSGNESKFENWFSKIVAFLVPNLMNIAVKSFKNVILLH